MYINMNELNHLIKKRQNNHKYVGLPLGSAIKYKREEMKMTLEEACAGISSVSYLSKLENNIIKPSPAFADKYKKRFDIKDDYVYDADGFKVYLEIIIRSHLLDEHLEETILDTFAYREDYESFLINFAYYVLNNEVDQIEYYYRKMIKSIISMPEEPFMVAILLINHILYEEMRYTEGLELLDYIENLNTSHERIKLSILKGKAKLAFKLNNYILISNTYHIYKDLLVHKQIFSQLKKIHLEKLVHDSKHKTYSDIIKEVNQIDTFDESDKQYVEAKCLYHKGQYKKALEFASKNKDVSIDWIMLYILSLEQLKDTEKTIKVIDMYKDTKNPRLKIILKHLKHKYKSNQDEQLNYIKRDIISFQGMTEDYEILNYLLKDCSQMLVKHQYYKDAVSLYKIFMRKISNLTFS